MQKRKKTYNIHKNAFPLIGQSNSLNTYLKSIASSKSLTLQEESKLSRRIKKGDEKAVIDLVQANLRFVVSVAKNYQNQGVSLEDLVSVGNVGLIKAARKFDGSKNFKFISYAVWWIRQQILQALADQSRISNIPLNKIAQIYKVRRSFERLEQKYHRRPSMEELQEDLNYDEKSVKETLAIDVRHISLDSPVSEKGDRTLLDVMYDENQENPDERYDRIATEDLFEIALASLPERERKILRMYFGALNNHMYTLDEIGKSMSITRERVRQLKDKGLKMLKGNPKTVKLLRGFI